MKRKILGFVLLLVALFGCSKQQERRHIVILPDVSGSIEPSALEQAFKAIDELSGSLRRGDKIAIIPILGDAEAEASGRIIRFEMPMNRQAYDSDLREFRLKLRSALQQMEARADAHPGAKTDILGSIVLAGQEFQIDKKSRRLLIVLSDFIQEDRNTDFNAYHYFGGNTTVKSLGMHSAQSLENVQVYLGLLLSHEYAAMSDSRRKAIREFWTDYFKASGAQAKFFTDGTGMLSQYFRIEIP